MIYFVTSAGGQEGRVQGTVVCVLGREEQG